MVIGGVAVYTGNDYFFYYSFVNTNGQQKRAIPYRYTNGEWKMIGGAGCLMVPFIDANGDKVYDSNGKAYLVRQNPLAGRRLKDSLGNYLTDSDGNYLITGGL